MRFTRPKKRRIRKEARSIPYKPRGDEKLWRCWNCGFICDEDRDDSSGGRVTMDLTVTALPSTGKKIISTQVGKKVVLFNKDAAGENKEVYKTYSSEAPSGCPFCGTRNYKG